jgi:hypothetical protein
VILRDSSQATLAGFTTGGGTQTYHFDLSQQSKATVIGCNLTKDIHVMDTATLDLGASRLEGSVFGSGSSTVTMSGSEIGGGISAFNLTTLGGSVGAAIDVSGAGGTGAITGTTIGSDLISTLGAEVFGSNLPSIGGRARAAAGGKLMLNDAQIQNDLIADGIGSLANMSTGTVGRNVLGNALGEVVLSNGTVANDVSTELGGKVTLTGGSVGGKVNAAEARCRSTALLSPEM